MQIFCRRKNTQKHTKNAQADYAITQGHAFGMFRCNRQCFNASPNMPNAKALKNYKIVNEVKVLWRLVAVGNG